MLECKDTKKQNSNNEHISIFCNFAIVLSNKQIRTIRSLSTKKGREKTGLFVAEGYKIVKDFIDSGFQVELILENENDIRRVSFLQHPQNILGVFKLKPKEFALSQLSIELQKNIVIGLDEVQDPGNLGTIIRIADWFGIHNIICSQTTADCWAPKVVQATMGSIARVNVTYCNLVSVIDDLPKSYPIYGTLLDGDNIYSQSLTNNGLILMGNEGNGLSKNIKSRVTQRLLIPNFSNNTNKAESLNVAVATAIICSEFKRRTK